MTKALAVGLLTASLFGPASVWADSNYTEVSEYVNRTAMDYCGKNKSCQSEFAQKLIYAYKDGENDTNSRYKNDTLIKKYAKKWDVLECSVAEAKDKSACHSMVDRLVDSYNRGLSTR